MGKGFSLKTRGVWPLLGKDFWEEEKYLEENRDFSGGNGGGLVLLVDRGFSEKWGLSW